MFSISPWVWPFKGRHSWLFGPLNENIDRKVSEVLSEGDDHDSIVCATGHIFPWAIYLSFTGKCCTVRCGSPCLFYWVWFFPPAFRSMCISFLFYKSAWPKTLDWGGQQMWPAACFCAAHWPGMIFAFLNGCILKDYLHTLILPLGPRCLLCSLLWKNFAIPVLDSLATWEWKETF